MIQIGSTKNVPLQVDGDRLNDKDSDHIKEMIHRQYPNIRSGIEKSRANGQMAGLAIEFSNSTRASGSASGTDYKVVAIPQLAGAGKEERDE